MAAECAQAGADFRVLVLPAHSDLALDRYWEPLTASLGVPLIDTYGDLRAAGALQDGGMWMPGGHYSEEGHRVVLETLLRVLD